MNYNYTLVAALLSGAAGHATAQTAPAVALDTVAVTGKVQQLTLALPGEAAAESHGLALGPAQQVAVLHRPPTTTHEYDIRSLTLHFSARYNLTGEGRVQVQLALPDSAGNPSTNYLLPNAFELTALQIRRAKRQVVTLSLQGSRLTLPPGGVFVVLTGLPNADERFVKDTTMLLRRGALRSIAAVKVQHLRSLRPRLVSLADYVSPVAVPTMQQPMTWQVRRSTRQWQRLPASYPNCPRCLIFNYWIDMGVTEL